MGTIRVFFGFLFVILIVACNGYNTRCESKNVTDFVRKKVEKELLDASDSKRGLLNRRNREVLSEEEYARLNGIKIRLGNANYISLEEIKELKGPKEGSSKKRYACKAVIGFSLPPEKLDTLRNVGFTIKDGEAKSSLTYQSWLVDKETMAVSVDIPAIWRTMLAGFLVPSSN